MTIIVDGVSYASEEIKNKYDNSPYRIPLRNRAGIIVEFALVDEQDFERTSIYNWILTGDRYATCKINGSSTRMHHFIFKKPNIGYVIDHINGDRLHNCQSNLREITQSENVHNCKKIITSKTTSKYKGVIRVGTVKERYRTQCKGNVLYYGEDEKKAALIYDIYTFQIFGKHANNNNIISYEEALKHELKDVIICDLPKNIKRVIKDGEEYFCVKKFLNKKLETHFFKELEDALKKIDYLDFLIQLSSIIQIKIDSITIPIYRNDRGIAVIIAKGGEHILVSDEDWYRLNRQKWHININGYPMNSTTSTLMHKMIRPYDSHDMVVHHINSNRTDNRRENLAVVSPVINAHQKKKKRNASSKYFGVNYDKQHKKWRAKITENGKLLHLGRYEKEEDAARAYDAKALEIYGNVFANLNFPDQYEKNFT